MLVAADEVIVVAQPDLANLRNAKNIIDNIRTARPHDHPPRLILNNVGVPKRPEIPVADFSKTIEMEPTCVIAHDSKLFGSAANNGQMIAEVEPKGKNAETFGNLANLIAGRGEVKKMKRGLFDPFFSKMSKKA
jgi:pilus assembly protein CpaE